MQVVGHYSPAAIAGELRATVSGRVVTPIDPEYERWRQIRNAAIDRHPAAIVRPPAPRTSLTLSCSRSAPGSSSQSAGYRRVVPSPRPPESQTGEDLNG
jgi:hypothetical protein